MSSREAVPETDADSNRIVAGDRDPEACDNGGIVSKISKPRDIPPDIEKILMDIGIGDEVWYELTEDLKEIEEFASACNITVILVESLRWISELEDLIEHLIEKRRSLDIDQFEDENKSIISYMQRKLFKTSRSLDHDFSGEIREEMANMSNEISQKKLREFTGKIWDIFISKLIKSQT